jgi:hypothetical protein
MMLIKSGKRKISVALIGLFFYFFLCLSSSVGFVLCLGSENHSAIESTHAFPLSSLHNDSLNSIIKTQASSKDHPSQCIDAPLLETGIRGETPRPISVMQLKASPLAASSFSLGLFKAFDETPFPFERNLSPAHFDLLATVVLLV